MISPCHIGATLFFMKRQLNWATTTNQGPALTYSKTVWKKGTLNQGIKRDFVKIKPPHIVLDETTFKAQLVLATWIINTQCSIKWALFNSILFSRFCKSISQQAVSFETICSAMRVQKKIVFHLGAMRGKWGAKKGFLSQGHN